MTGLEIVLLIGGVSAVLNMLYTIFSSEHANQQRSAIEAKLDWILSTQSDHTTRLTVLESRWMDYDEHPSQRNR